MAKAMQYVPIPPTPEEKLAADTRAAQEALSESLELLRELHERGGLELLIKLLRGGSGLTEAVLEKMNEPTVLRGLRNLIALAEVVGSIEPTELKLLTSALSEGVNGAAHNIAEGERVSVTGAMKQLADPDVQLGLSAGLGLLAGLGRGMREAREEQHGGGE